MEGKRCKDRAKSLDDDVDAGAMFVIEGKLHGVVRAIDLEALDVGDDIISDCVEFGLTHMTNLR